MSAPARPNASRPAIKVKYAVRIIPYYQQDDQFYLLLGLAVPWLEWTPLGGTCWGVANLACLRRELMEESKKILGLEANFDLSQCQKITYTEEIAPSRHQGYYRYDIRNTIYFVKWSVKESSTRSHLIQQFRDPDYNNKLRAQLSPAQQKAHFEMGDLEIFNIKSPQFTNYLYNTLKDHHLRVKEFKDNRVTHYLHLALGSLLDIAPIKYLDKTEGQRFDVRFLAGLVTGLQTYLGVKFKTLGDIVITLEQFLSKNQCQSTLSN